MVLRLCQLFVLDLKAFQASGRDDFKRGEANLTEMTDFRKRLEARGYRCLTSGNGIRNGVSDTLFVYTTAKEITSEGGFPKLLRDFQQANITQIPYRTSRYFFDQTFEEFQKPRA
jgi:hypothetical protein